MSDAVVAERRRIMESVLQQIARTPKLACSSLVLEFLGARGPGKTELEPQEEDVSSLFPDESVSGTLMGMFTLFHSHSLTCRTQESMLHISLSTVLTNNKQSPMGSGPQWLPESRTTDPQRLTFHFATTYI